MSESPRKKLQKLLETHLTNGKKSGIIIKRSGRGARIPLKKRESGDEEKGFEKNFKKLFENPLTNGKESGIINRLSQRDGTERHGAKPDGL